MALLALLAALVARPVDAHAKDTQFTMIDQTLVDTANEYGAIEHTAPPSWYSPVNYAAGNVFVRFDFTDRPSDLEIDLQLCLWQDDFTVETCSGRTRTDRSGIHWIDLGTPNEWWQLNGDFRWGAPIETARFMFKDAATQTLLKETRCGDHCYPGDDLHDHVPMTFDVVMVVVARSATLSPPEGFEDCPASWSPDCTGPDEPFTIDAGPDVTVERNVEVQLTAAMTGPPPSSIVWSKRAGPGGIAWTDKLTATPRAEFRALGTYVLRVKASSAAGQAIDEIRLEVVAPGDAGSSVAAGSEPPEGLAVDAGEALTVPPQVWFELHGEVTGARGVPGVSWFKVSGPGGIDWRDKATTTPEVRIATPGVYVVRFKATDGGARATDDLEITVDPSSDPVDSGGDGGGAVGDGGASEPSGAGPSWRVLDASVAESGGTMVFRIELSERAQRDLTIRVGTVGGTASAPDDYRARESVVVTVSKGKTVGHFGVPVVSDSRPEADETIDVEIREPSLGTVARAAATGTIVDDD